MRQLAVTDAQREAVKAKVALSGGPGFGKTWTALRIARTLSPTGHVMVIDTEHESARLYAPPFEFKHAPWEPPYDPRELTEAIRYYSRFVEVLIVDSLSHFWQGEGGILDTASGKFTGWKEARPMQRAMVDAIVQSPCHVIGCMRSKIEYTQETTPGGRQVVKKLGTADIQSDDMAYEFTIAAELDVQHRLTITKTRCHDLPLGRVFAPDREVDMAMTLLGWLDAAPGSPPTRTEPEVPPTQADRSRVEGRQPDGKPGADDGAAPNAPGATEVPERAAAQLPPGRRPSGTTKPAREERSSGKATSSRATSPDDEEQALFDQARAADDPGRHT